MRYGQLYLKLGSVSFIVQIISDIKINNIMKLGSISFIVQIISEARFS